MKILSFHMFKLFHMKRFLMENLWLSLYYELPKYVTKIQFMQLFTLKVWKYFWEIWVYLLLFVQYVKKKECDIFSKPNTKWKSTWCFWNAQTESMKYLWSSHPWYFFFFYKRSIISIFIIPPQKYVYFEKNERMFVFKSSSFI